MMVSLVYQVMRGEMVRVIVVLGSCSTAANVYLHLLKRVMMRDPYRRKGWRSMRERGMSFGENVIRGGAGVRIGLTD